MVYWVDNPTAVAVKPKKDLVHSAVAKWFNDQLGVTPTIPRAEWFNMIQSEMLSIADALGVKPDKLNDEQIGAALKLVLDKVDKIPVLTSVLGTSKTLAASQFLANEVSKSVDLVSIQVTKNTKSLENKMDVGAFGLGGRSEDYGVTINRDFDQLELITQFFTVTGAWLNSPIKATSTVITGLCVTIARKYDAGVTLRVDLYIEQGHFYRERRGVVWGEWKQPMSVGDFGFGGKLAITGNIFDKEASGFYRDQSATLYPTQSSINALSVGYSKDRMNGIMFQAASLDAWIYESATRKMAKIITTADLDSLLQVPVDQIFYFDSATPPTGYIARNGQAIDKVKMPKLFARYGANMPDDRDLSYRNTGPLAGAVGTRQEDAMQKITGVLADQYNGLGYMGGGAFSVSTGNANNYYVTIGEVPGTTNAQLKIGESKFDSSSQTRTATESRVKSRIIIGCNKIQ